MRRRLIIPPVVSLFLFIFLYRGGGAHIYADHAPWRSLALSPLLGRVREFCSRTTFVCLLPNRSCTEEVSFQSKYYTGSRESFFDGHFFIPTMVRSKVSNL